MNIPTKPNNEAILEGLVVLVVVEAKRNEFTKEEEIKRLDKNLWAI